MDDAQKNPLVKTLQSYTQAMIDHFVETQPKSLPCTIASVDDTNTVVTVNIEVQDPVLQFPQVTVPVLYPKYVRYPLKAGDPGLLVPSDVYLGGVSGLGGGTATMAAQGNLSTLGFLALAGPKPGATDDPKAHVIYGPNGVVLRDEDKKCIFTLTPEGIAITLNGETLMNFSADGVSLNFQNRSISITSTGIVINGQTETTIDGQVFLPHEHTGVQTGSGNSGPVST